MALFKMVSVFDSKVNTWYPPLYVPSLGHALRSFTELANNPNSDFFKYAEDFHIYVIGEWEDQMNEFKSHPPESLGAFTTLKKAFPVTNSVHPTVENVIATKKVKRRRKNLRR